MQCNRKNITNFISLNLLPTGLLLFLIGMFFLSDKDEFKKLFYVAVLFPTALTLLMDKQLFIRIKQSPILIAIIIFLTYASLTVLWSDSDRSLMHYLKRELYIVTMIMSFTLVHLFSPIRFYQLIGLSVIAASAFAFYFLLTEPSLLWGDSGARISGGGALYNPLLSAHIFGFFWAVSIASILEITWEWRAKLFAVIISLPLTTFILMTQSRTPLLAMALMIFAYLLIHRNFRSLITISLFLVALSFIFLIYPDILTNRGLSYRPYIWQNTLNLVRENLVFGVGIDNYFSIPHPSKKQLSWGDPHNIHLAVLLYTGIVGLILWISIYWNIFKFSVLKENSPISRLFFLVVVFGASCALTEGRAFFSRPQTHWFIIWIPMALIIAIQVSSQLKSYKPLKQ